MIVGLGGLAAFALALLSGIVLGRGSRERALREWRLRAVVWERVATDVLGPELAQGRAQLPPPPAPWNPNAAAASRWRAVRPWLLAPAAFAGALLARLDGQKWSGG